jgi:V8-like Glu-specific endopeptidase
MIIGCDSRIVKPDSIDGATTEPWSFTGTFYHDSGGGFCSGTLIGNRWILTSAHCLIGEGEVRLGFALAQEILQFWGRPYGTHGVRRVFVPAHYQNTDSETMRAYDYALAELWEPIEAATPAKWGHEPWSTMSKGLAYTVGYPGDPPDGVFGRPFMNFQDFHDNQPYAWLENGEAGLLYTYLDGTGGQSGSPVYLEHLDNKVIGVLMGSPVAACQQDQIWVARLTPGAVQHIENALENSSDPFWTIVTIPTSPTSGPGEPWP